MENQAGNSWRSFKNCQVKLRLSKVKIKVHRISEIACGLEIGLEMVQSVNDQESFLSDISALLREMNCPYQSLFNGPYEERLDTAQKKASLISYLVGEIQTMKIIGVNNSKRQLWKLFK